MKIFSLFSDNWWKFLNTSRQYCLKFSSFVHCKFWFKFVICIQIYNFIHVCNFCLKFHRGSTVGTTFAQYLNFCPSFNFAQCCFSKQIFLKITNFVQFYNWFEIAILSQFFYFKLQLISKLQLLLAFSTFVTFAQHYDFCSILQLLS